MPSSRTRLPALTALAVLAALAVGQGTATSAPTPAPASAPATQLRAGGAGSEVWQRVQQAHTANPTNPLAGRKWGVYDGPQDQVTAPYERATGRQKRLIGKIALRPRAKWYSSWATPAKVEGYVRKYIADSQDGNERKLVQMTLFRMRPWEHAACGRASTRAERREYRRWIDNLATGIDDTPMMIVLQPDGPFIWCVPDRQAKSRLLTYASKTLSALPDTHVYIDGGAADWCENQTAPDPARCVGILRLAGIEHARGFALDSTHYNGPVENIRHGTAMVELLEEAGYGEKHFIVDTAKAGRPMRWSEVIPASKDGLKNNARTCKRKRMQRCVTLGAPPTARPGDAPSRLPDDVAVLAEEHVDGLVWIGRPWLYNQADPFVKRRALDMARTTPFPGPDLG